MSAGAAEPPLVVLFGRAAVPQRNRLAASLTTSWTIAAHQEDESADRVAASLARADALVGTCYDAATPPTPRLRLLQVPAAGYDRVDLACVPAACSVANAYGHEEAIAEYVMAGILRFVVDLPRQDAELRRGDWRSGHVLEGPLRPELTGATLGLVGIGHIGRAVAVRARAFGMRVIGTARRSRVPPDGIDELVALDWLLRESDHIVIACPLDETTCGLIDAAALARMKPQVILVNVGRGPVIDERALFEALSERRIGGAVIDVWYRYPNADEPNVAPSDLPFETLENIVMTPHSSGWTLAMIERRWAAIAANLDALATGRPLANLIRHAQQRRP